MSRCAAALLACVALPATAGDAERIVGTWKLVSVVYEDAQTKERTPVLGAHPKGYQIATAGGRWLALVTAEGRPVPKTDEERANALRTMISYSGRYRLEDGKVVTRVEAAWNEAWVGTEQVRAYRFDGNLLHLESPPQPHPNIGGRVVRIIVTWEKEEG
ncbi:MAG TPA: lipocalin-like domain-containing protein [Burkholderiales bacterium]|nr:lipocalin-like domain-containing protein [Burkholderiales bacterium]